MAKTTKPASKKPVKPIIHPLMMNGKDWKRARVIDYLCEQLATTESGIASILKAGYQGQVLPGYSSVMAWLAEDKELSDKYARAKESQADLMAERMLEISDSDAEYVVDQNGVSHKDSADVQHKRLRVDTRKWLASKLKPKKYGDKIDHELTGKDGAPLIPESAALMRSLSGKELEELTALLGKIGAK